MFVLFYEARSRGGNILINGLGLGCAVAGCLTFPNVNKITVIEISTNVIQLVAPSYKNDPRVEIIESDAYEWKAPRGSRWSIVWHDIWDSICADNIEGMTKLHRRYGKRSDVQASWCRDECYVAKRRWSY